VKHCLRFGMLLLMVTLGGCGSQRSVLISSAETTSAFSYLTVSPSRSATATSEVQSTSMLSPISPSASASIEPRPEGIPTLASTPTSFPLLPATRLVNAVAFIVGDWQYGGADSLWIANLDGSGDRPLLDDVSQVAWSPASDQLACIRQGDLWALSSNGQIPQNALASEDERGPIVLFSWSSDATRLAFVQKPSGNETSYLAISEVEGVGRVDLLTSRDRIISLAWAPNGEWIAFRTVSGLWVVNVANAESRYLEIPGGLGGGIEQVSWSPRSDALAVLFLGNGR
jgi:dipeptidyl aminopeptidase/acylaminoacyl peptidase